MQSQEAQVGLRRMPWLAAAAVVALAGCAGGDLVPGSAGGPAGADDAGATECARPAPGCACQAGDEPVTCYADPEPTSAGLYCREGLMHCRDGTWSACETVRTFTLDRRYAALITDPTACNPCNPACFQTTDQPDDTDLTPDNSDNVEYDPGAGGVTVVQVPVNPMLPDTDGDGLPDLGEQVVADGGFFHVLPYGGTSEIDPLPIDVQVTTADVYFMIDDSGSMDGEIANLKSDLTSGTFNGCSGGIIGAIQCTIPDAWVGVGSFEEYPEYPFGYSSNLPYKHHQDITDDVAAAQAAVNGLTIGGNIDWPEADTQALWSMATGNGLNGVVADRGACANGGWGYPCFRPDTIPIVVLVTDAPFHNGPNPAYDYDIAYFELGEFDFPTTYTPLGNIDGPYPNVGDVYGKWLGFSGDTTGLSDTWWGWGCGAGHSPDGAFYFYLSKPNWVAVTTYGTSYDSVLGVVDRVNGRLYCDDDDTGYGQTSRMNLYLPAGLHMVVLDGDGDNQSGPFQVSIGTTLRPTWQDTLQALNSRGFKVIVVESSEGYSDAYENSVALANATGSTDQSGNPYVFSIGTDGSGITSSIVDAVDRVANNTRFDVSVSAVDPTPDGTAENGPDNGVDETGFVKSITPLGWTAGSCAGTTSNGFSQCTPGTQLDLQVEFRNDFIQPLPNQEQVFDFEIHVRLDNTLQQTIPVRIVVPAEVPTYPASGSYWRDYDAGTTCTIPPQRPDWGSVDYQVSTPSDTAVRFELRTAATEAELDSATAATFSVPADGPDTGTFDVGQVLLDADLPINLPWLRVQTVLLPSSDQLSAPVLNGFDLQYNCVAGE